MFKIYITFIILLSCFSFIPNRIDEGEMISMPVIVKNIRNLKGHLSIGVFKNASSFDKEKPFKIILIAKKEIENGTLKSSIVLPSGVYGLSILDDENSDYKMQYNLIGVPKEGFGFSNYYHSGFSKPNFNLFIVKVNSQEKRTINFTLRYIL